MQGALLLSAAPELRQTNFPVGFNKGTSKEILQKYFFKAENMEIISVVTVKIGPKPVKLDDIQLTIWGLNKGRWSTSKMT